MNDEEVRHPAEMTNLQKLGNKIKEVHRIIVPRESKAKKRVVVLFRVRETWATLLKLVRRGKKKMQKYKAESKIK